MPPPPFLLSPIILCDSLGIKPSAFEAELYSQLLSVFKMTEEKRREDLDDLTSFLNVNHDGTLNEAVNEERMQLERTEVEDERVKKDPLNKLMGMKWKQQEHTKKVPRETP